LNTGDGGGGLTARGWTGKRAKVCNISGHCRSDGDGKGGRRTQVETENMTTRCHLRGKGFRINEIQKKIGGGKRTNSKKEKNGKGIGRKEKVKC